MADYLVMENEEEESEIDQVLLTVMAIFVY